MVIAGLAAYNSLGITIDFKNRVHCTTYIGLDKNENKLAQTLSSQEWLALDKGNLHGGILGFTITKF